MRMIPGLQDLRSKMEDLKVAGRNVGLRINAAKTKLMKIMATQCERGGIGQGRIVVESL